MITTAQIAILRPVVLAEQTLAAARLSGDDVAIAAWCNATATPSFTVWRTSVPLAEVVANVDGVELVGLTAIKLAAYQSLLLAGSVNPSKDRLRAGFDQVFSAAGGQTTRPLLLALWKRLATRAEKALATGTGSDGSPAYLTWESTVTTDDASLLR